MAHIRERNNFIKRTLLNTYVPKGSKVLDIGCGQGGDLHKWKHLGVELTGVDPNKWAIEEAKRRSKGYGTFLIGDILSAPLEQYDVICYNFSLQYQSLDLFSEIVKRLKKPNGILIGVVTDQTLLGNGKEDGIEIENIDDKYIKVYIPDTPYYANGPVMEPILNKNKLFQEAMKNDMEIVLWETFSIYAKFVFRYK